MKKLLIISLIVLTILNCKKTKSVGFVKCILPINKDCIFIGKTNGLYFFNNDSLSAISDEYIHTILQKDDSTIWIATWNGLFETDIYKQGLKKVEFPDSTYMGLFKGYPIILKKIEGENTVYASTRLGVYALKENESNWNLLTKNINSITYFEVHPSGVFVAITMDNKICISNDYGTLWHRAKISIPLKSLSISGLAISKYNAIYVTTLSDYVLKTNWAGDEWEKIYEDLPDEYIDTILIIEKNGVEEILVSTNSTIYCSEDKGANWKDVDTNASLQAFLFIDELQGTLFGVSEIGYIYRLEDNDKGWEMLYEPNVEEFYKAFDNL